MSNGQVMFDLAHYEQLLYEKRREATQATLNASSRESNSLRLLSAASFIPAKNLLPVTSLLPTTSLIPATSLLPATRLSPARQQAALPKHIFRCRHHQILMIQTSSNSPHPPPTSASKDFRPLLVSIFVFQNVYFIYIYYFCILKCLLFT